MFRFISRKIAEWHCRRYQFSIGKGSAYQILHEKNRSGQYGQGNARWVLKQLTEDQKASRMTTAKEHLGRFNHDENKVLNCIFTGDVMWVHYAEPETKAQSKLWKPAGSPSPKKFKLSPSVGKVMLVAFWDSHGIILAHFAPKGRTVTARYYSNNSK